MLSFIVFSAVPPVPEDGGVSLFARILARVLDMLACLEGSIMTRPAAWLSGEVLPQGWGLTRAARGVLFHKADVQAGKIKAYTVATNFISIFIFYNHKWII